MVRDRGMDIAYQDEHFVAVNKPAGLLVHRSSVDRHATVYALQLVRDKLGERVYPLHRLDKPTCGALLFARSAQMARRMMGLFERGAVEKCYLAVVRGHTPERGVIDYALAEQHDKMTDARAKRDKPPQSAVTNYERLAIAELPFAVGRYASARYSLLRVRPRTGRKHQIRRHMKHVFHPIVGDTTHGDGRHNHFFREHFDCGRLLLAATALSFTHPHTGAPVTVRAALDDEFRRVLQALGWPAATYADWAQ